MYPHNIIKYPVSIVYAYVMKRPTHLRRRYNDCDSPECRKVILKDIQIFIYREYKRCEKMFIKQLKGGMYE